MTDALSQSNLIAAAVGIAITVIGLKHPLAAAALSALWAKVKAPKPADPPATPPPSPEDLVELARARPEDLTDRELLDRLDADLDELARRREVWEKVLNRTQPPTIKP